MSEKLFIQRVVLEEVSYPLKTPFKTALREATHSQSLYVKIYCTNGIIGIGECTETIAITGESLSSQRYIIENFFIPRLQNRNILEYESLLSELHLLAPNNYSAKAAVDCAIYDCVSQFYQLPIYQLLGGKSKELLTSVTVSLNNLDQMIKQTRNYLEHGYKLLKLKLGNEIEKDIERFIELSRVVPEDVIFRIDANQGWTFKEAWRFINETHVYHHKIQFLEQPVHKLQLQELKQLKNETPISIMADESIFDCYEAKVALELGAMDAINIKLMKCGGISQAMQLANLAKIYQVPCMLGCMLETEVAIYYAIQVAYSNSNIDYVDLDSPLLINHPLQKLNYINGKITIQ